MKLDELARAAADDLRDATSPVRGGRTPFESVVRTKRNRTRVRIVVAMLASMWLLAQAIRVLPAGTGYAVWVGIGAVGTAMLGIILLGESRNPLRLASILLVVAGIVGLKFAK